MKTNNPHFKRILSEIKKMSPTARLILAEHIFGNQMETDNSGQFVIYTGFVRSDSGRIRYLKDEDL